MRKIVLFLVMAVVILAGIGCSGNDNDNKISTPSPTSNVDINVNEPSESDVEFVTESSLPVTSPTPTLTPTPPPSKQFVCPYDGMVFDTYQEFIDHMNQTHIRMGSAFVPGDKPPQTPPVETEEPPSPSTPTLPIPTPTPTEKYPCPYQDGFVFDTLPELMAHLAEYHADACFHIEWK